MLIIILKSESVCRFCNLYPESNNLLHSSDRWIFDCIFLVYDEMENISMNKISIYTFFKFKKTEAAEIS